jgi:RNA polymerase sigma-70 factor, ECF subfamily
MHDHVLPKPGATGEGLLREILLSHGAALWRIARAYGDADGEAEDLHQEILLQLWRSLSSYRGDAAPGTWTYRVALNTALAWRRRNARRLRTESAPRNHVGASAGEPRSEAAILGDFLGVLSPVDRSVLILYLEGLVYQEIGEVTGLSAGAVGVRLHRIRQEFTSRHLEE